MSVSSTGNVSLILLGSSTKVLVSVPQSSGSWGHHSLLHAFDHAQTFTVTSKPQEACNFFCQEKNLSSNKYLDGALNRSGGDASAFLLPLPVFLIILGSTFLKLFDWVRSSFPGRVVFVCRP